MTIKYTMTLRANIVFDSIFTYSGMSDGCPLDDLIEKAKYCMSEYNFVTADIVDAETGEVLVEVEQDWQEDEFNDDEPAYYDDGDSCGYE